MFLTSLKKSVVPGRGARADWFALCLILLLPIFSRGEDPVAYTEIKVDSAAVHAYGNAQWNRKAGRLALAGTARRDVWRDGWVAPLDGNLQRDEWLWVRVRARALETPDSETGELRLPWVVEQLRAPRRRAVDAELRAGPEWGDHMAFGRVAADMEPGKAGIVLHLGAARGVMQIGEIEVRRYPPETDPARLPRSPVRWGGRDSDAAWRREARARIQKLRRGDLVVDLRDREGAPLRNREVKTRMRRHRFRFGTAVGANQLLDGEDENTERYRRALVQHFEWATVENALKWEAEDWGMVDLRLPAVRTLTALGLEVRGHVLLWPSYKNSPAFLKDKSPVELAEAIRTRVEDAASEMRPWIREWDVVNEPWSNHDFMDLLGDEVVGNAFRRAREALPEGRLYINDYGILNEGRPHTTHKDAYAEWIRKLLEEKAPLDGVGLQGHFGARVPDVSEMKDTLDRFAAFGLPLTITEFDHDIRDEEAQADFLRDVLTLCFSHPAVDGFWMWGFWDGRHWRDNAPLYRRDWTPKPALDVWERLVWDEWRTPDRTLATDAEGRLRLPSAYYGTYILDTETDGERFEIHHAPDTAGTPQTATPADEE